MLEFPTRSGSWLVTAEQAAKWMQTFPALNVIAELQKALAWIEANASRRKTNRGMPRFLVSWLLRASRQPPSRKQAPGPPTNPSPPYFESCRLNGHVPPCPDYHTHLRKFGMRVEKIGVDNTRPRGVS